MKQGRVIINRNICDNASECSGIAVCPTGALFWDENKEEIAHNPSVCIDCGICADADAGGCPIGAIRWGIDDAEYDKIQAEVAKETRSLSELEVERYGATPIEPYIKLDEVQAFIANVDKKYSVLELFNDESIVCLLHSIRAQEIKSIFADAVCYKKVWVENVQDFTLCSITEVPSLVIMEADKVIGSVSGYYDDARKDEFFALIKGIIEHK